jgi:hypothetical protein
MIIATMPGIGNAWLRIVCVNASVWQRAIETAQPFAP